ncbi:MAG: leucyl/phenylalanyl-tRNA--protein transferase [Pseudomonadota bacterium]
MLVLTPELLLCAYGIGMFPMANDRNDPTVHWIDPIRRGVLPLPSLHVPRRLRKTVRRRPYELKVNAAFARVIQTCAEPTPERPRTWLNEDLIRVYVQLHHRGHAHSVECWQDDKLVGGLYGISMGSAFFGESMFSRERDASKIALVELAARLTNAGFILFDTQFVTDHLKQFGAREMPRPHYRQLLDQALMQERVFPSKPDWFSGPYLDSLASGGSSDDESGSSIGFKQSITQTS